MSIKKTAEIITTTLETSETVLAKKERLHQEEISSQEQVHNTHVLTPLKYGNKTQALAKIESIRPQLEEGDHTAKIIKQGGRFLIQVEYCKDDYTEPPLPGELMTECWRDWSGELTLKSPMSPVSPTSPVSSVSKPVIASKRPPFATIAGQRMNPRNRHNHPTNTADERYYYEC